MGAVGRVVIIGGGQAGGEAAAQLRARKFSGEISLICEESLPPYQRPPLSKAFLAGELGEDRLPLRPREIYEDEAIDLRLGVRALAVDRAAKRVQIEGGVELSYDALVLATGARPRRLGLPGERLPGVHYFRTAADVAALRPRFRPGARLAVIGAGYIGLEVAAVARTQGLDVTVVESMARPLARVTSADLAAFFQAQHEARGVRFRFGARAGAIEAASGALALRLEGGDTVEADLIIIGVGVTPEIGLAQAAGLALSSEAAPMDGVITDALTRTSDPSIYAIGDCARRPIALLGRAVRLESVHNAIEGGKIAAAAILGQEPPVAELPWFWSDQFDLKLTIGGLSQGYDAIVTRGNRADRSFALFYYRAGRLIAVDAVNRPADYLGAKLALQRAANLPPEWVADESRPMKEIVAAAR